MKYDVKYHGNVSDCNMIVKWVDVVRTTGSVMKQKPPGLPVSGHMLESVERVIGRSQKHETFHSVPGFSFVDVRLVYTLHLTQRLSFSSVNNCTSNDNGSAIVTHRRFCATERML